MSDQLWHKPKHHEDLAHKNHHVAWIELFYDLVHVVCVFLLGGYLSHHLNISGFLMFAAVFTLIWMAWGDTVYYTSLYVSNDATHRIIMAFQICAVMVFAAAIPNLPGNGEFYFALGYAANRALLALMYYRAIVHNDADRKSVAFEMCRMFAIAALLFFISAFLPAPLNYIVWLFTIVLLQLGYVLPKLGVMRYKAFSPRIEHLSERFALLVLIVIGEGFFKLVVTLADKGVYKVGPAVFFNYVLGGLALCVLCWVYFDFVGNGKIKSTKKHMSRWWYSHLFLMMAAIMIGVAMTGEVKIGFFEPFPAKYSWVGCTGLVIFLMACWSIQTSIEERFAHNFYGIGLRIFGISLALLTLALTNYIPAILGNTLYFIALFSQILIPIHRTQQHFKSKIETSNS